MEEIKDSISLTSDEILEMSDQDIEEAIQKNPELLKDAVLVQRMMKKFSGPIPHPEILEGYNQICPASAEKIINHFVKEQDHRHKIENIALEQSIKITNKSFNFAIIFCLLVFVTGSIAAFTGHVWFASILLTTFIGTVLAAFLGLKRKGD